MIGCKMSESPPLMMISVYDEDQLLHQVNNALRDVHGPSTGSADRSALQRLARKLKVRRIQRRNGLPVFDLDLKARQIWQKHSDRFQGKLGAGPQDPKSRISDQDGPTTSSSLSSTRVLDRFQVTTWTFASQFFFFDWLINWQCLFIIRTRMILNIGDPCPFWPR